MNALTPALNRTTALPRATSEQPTPADAPPLDSYVGGSMSLVDAKAPVLHAVAAPVRTFGPAVRRLLSDMSDAMREKGGIGLAAPQVGIPYRMIIVKARSGEVRMANPEIVRRSGGTLSLEGCLSLPGRMGLLWRSSHVVVRGQNDQGKPIEVDARGLEARCFQHEIDHLDGVLYPDRALLTPLNMAGLMLGGVVGAALSGGGGAAIGGLAAYAVSKGWERLRGTAKKPAAAAPQAEAG